MVSETKVTVDIEVNTLRELLTEAHGIMKDLKQLIKEAKETEQSLRKAIEEEIEEDFAEHIRQGLVEYENSLRNAMDEGFDHVMKQVDKLTNNLMYGNSQGRGPSLMELTAPCTCGTRTIWNGELVHAVECSMLTGDVP